MKLILFLLLTPITFVLKAQQGLPLLVTSTIQGKIYEINVNDCSGRFICATGKDFNDIAFTPNGKLYGRTVDSLFKIDTITGNTFAIGRAPLGNGLVGLNDSTLFIDSLQYLIAIKTTNANTSFIGNMANPLHGDISWVGNFLYASVINVPGSIIRMKFDDLYQSIIDIDTIVDSSNPYFAGITIALASVKESNEYKLIAFIGNTSYYWINPETGENGLLCDGTVVSTSGAASTLFPPMPELPTAVSAFHANDISVIKVYPNPTHSNINIEVDNNDNYYQATIIDVFGNVLFTEAEFKRSLFISTAHLVSGLYYLKVQDRNHQVISFSKIVKE